MRSPNNLFLTALAVFDSCLLITAFFIYAMEYIIEYTQAFDLYVAWLTYLRFAFALSHISQTGSVYITVSVTIERYLAVILNPLCPDGNNWQSFILTPSMMAANPHYQQVVNIYTLWLTNFVMVFLPFITLLVLNAYIAYTIRRSLKKFDHRQQKTLFVALSTTNSFARGMARKELFIVYGCEGRGITMNLPVANKFNIWRIQWIQGGKKPRGLYSDICGERNISTSTIL
ncbi:hypothetical protein DICVIV_08309 [Dictyocaulus viviparus]|uniref:G-protein coupled receptors family 1 profile domain-containing protein n=1 Tax=Dictyocaulus viviparus TaxID=29172 RepID=A0A0D8XTC4_DICVI|nr:hypothetical protein DICVIV_08309 [Dictyocaulus viviparus]